MTQHRCPVEGCCVMLDSQVLMCLFHWFTVPEGLRRRVIKEWRDDPGGPVYFLVRAAAIDAANRIALNRR